VIAMKENRSTKPVDNFICGMDGCTRPAKEKAVFSLGFSAGFCEHCANRLRNKGIDICRV
jgi:hypothetical protein